MWRTAGGSDGRDLLCAAGLLKWPWVGGYAIMDVSVLIQDVLNPQKLVQIQVLDVGQVFVYKNGPELC